MNQFAARPSFKDSISLRAFGTKFSPKEPRSLTYGKETLMVYPKFTPNMPLSEKAHAFNLNKSAIDSSSLSPALKLQLMGSLHNSETVVSIIKTEWEEFTFENARQVSERNQRWASDQLPSQQYHVR